MLDAVVMRAPSADLADGRDAVWESLWANLTFSIYGLGSGLTRSITVGVDDPAAGADHLVRKRHEEDLAQNQTGDCTHDDRVERNGKQGTHDGLLTTVIAANKPVKPGRKKARKR
jgi:hypothetical protein